MPDIKWRLRMLGGFELERDGRVVTAFAHRRQDVLLAYLALKPTTAHSRPTVALTLWPGKNRRYALNRITEVLVHLNRQLDAAGVDVELIAGRRQTIQLGAGVRTDLQDFEDLIAAAMRATDPAEQVGLLEQAVTLHGTGLLPVLDEPWVVEERARLSAVRDYAARLLVEQVGAGEARPPAEVAVGAGVGAVDVARYLARGRQMAGDAPSTVATTTLGAGAGRATEAGAEGIVEDVAPPMGRVLVDRCVALAEQAEPYLRGPDRRPWLDRLDARRAELHQAIEWALEHERAEPALRLTGALWRWWYSRDRVDEGLRYVEQALTLVPRPEGRWYAKAAHAAGALALHDGDLATARRRFEAALPIWRELEDGPAIGRVLDDLGLIAYKAGDLELAAKRYDESLAVLHQVGDAALRATVLRNAANTARAMGRDEQAEALLRQRLALGRELGDADVIAWTLIGLAGDIREQEGAEAVAAVIAEARALFVRLDDARGLATCLRAQGYSEQLAGRLDAARAYYDSSLALCQARQDVWGIGESERYLAAAAEAAGDLAEAREHASAAALLLADVGEQLEAAKARAALADLDAAPGRAGPATAPAPPTGDPPATGS
jgi:hypothetical protein